VGDPAVTDRPGNPTPQDSFFKYCAQPVPGLRSLNVAVVCLWGNCYDRLANELAGAVPPRKPRLEWFSQNLI